MRILGPNKYGLVMFIQAIAQYFVLLTGYGFNISGPSQIAIKRQDSYELSRVVTSILFSKVLLLLASLIVFCGLVLAVPIVRIHWLLSFGSFGYVVADVAFPIWLLQGIEDMKFITIGNVIAKSLSTLAVFLLIRHQSDYWMVPLIMSVSTILGGGISFGVAFAKHNLRLAKIGLRDIVGQLKDGWLVFVSTISISLYTTSNPVILGMFANTAIVGYYTAAEKLINAGQGLLNAVLQAIYPHVAQLFHSSLEKGLLFIRRVITIIAPSTFAVSLGIIALAKPVIVLILGAEYGPSVGVLRILALLPFLISLSNIFGIQTMLNNGMKRPFTVIISIGAACNLVMSFSLVPFFHQIGTAISVTFSEFVITLTMFLVLQIRGINTFTGKAR
ncbi:flippase [Alicyclobacillus sp. SO9]|nr:flippase [Alicyclobacillus sp. SO9]